MNGLRSTTFLKRPQLNPIKLAMNLVKRGAFLTMESLDGFFCSDHLTYEPLARLGWTIDEVPWTQTEVRWDDFDLVVIRSPWDYTDNPQAFLKVLEQIDRSNAALANPLDIVRWNLNKEYLRELEAQGIPVVPTLWLTKLEHVDIEAAFERFASEEIVVKPTVGANARDTFRLARDSAPSTTEAALRVFRSCPVMVQPFIKSIVDIGEYSLFYFNGNYSHCILKSPKLGDFRVQEEHGGLIQRCNAPPSLLEIGQRTLNTIDAQLLYARVDFVYLFPETPAVIEVELIEPSLYFPYAELSPARFASALDSLYRAR